MVKCSSMIVFLNVSFVSILCLYLRAFVKHYFVVTVISYCYKIRFYSLKIEMIIYYFYRVLVLKKWALKSTR